MKLPRIHWTRYSRCLKLEVCSFAFWLSSLIFKKFNFKFTRRAWSWISFPFHFPCYTYRHYTSLLRHLYFMSSNVRVYCIRLCSLLKCFWISCDRCLFGTLLYLPKSMQSFGSRPRTSTVLLIRYHLHGVISFHFIGHSHPRATSCAATAMFQN